MKIAIIVHGRFHAFELALSMLDRGHDTKVFTNYPKWATRRFGLPDHAVRSCWPHGIASKCAETLTALTGAPYPEAALHSYFGRWVASQLAQQEWDVIHCFSGIAEEILQASKVQARIKFVVRGSCHIRTQAELLIEEERRAGVPLDQPSRWRIEREEREYELADKILTLSDFSYQSFIDRGVPSEKLIMFLPGVRNRAFRPDASIPAERCRRIKSAEPLRVLYVGNLSFQKGILDAAAMIKQLGSERFRFRLVGHMLPEAKAIVSELGARVEIIPHQPESTLKNHYAWADTFLFPTVQDGFGQVVIQALASGVPVLTTTNCSGPNIIEACRTGWVLPVRDPQAFVNQLNWCDSHRAELAGMVEYLYSSFTVRDWAVAGADFEELCNQLMPQAQAAVTR